jgi:hypothetical protein
MSPVESMTLDEIRAELRQVFGKPWTSESDGARRQAMWRRLDQIVAEQPTRPLPAGPDVEPPEPDYPEQPIDERARPRPPDLQELVARHGGYDKITKAAWAAYDKAMAEYHIVRRVIRK